VAVLSVVSSVGCSATDGSEDEAASEEPVSLEENIALAAQAYTYDVGGPMFFIADGPPHGPRQYNNCTGGYAIKTASTDYLLTAGHCVEKDRSAIGYSAKVFGVAKHNLWPKHDTAVVKLLAGNTARQIVHDPKTGRRPNKHGKVVGVVPTTSLRNGLAIGKMGMTTGWTEGVIVGKAQWHDMEVVCADASTGNFAWAGDSGGPVWRNGKEGLRAVGITVSYNKLTGRGCFVPVERLLKEWKATMPVHRVKATSASAAARDVEPSDEVLDFAPSEKDASVVDAMESLPILSSEGLEPATL
jgi:hypothetical protein